MARSQDRTRANRLKRLDTNSCRFRSRYRCLVVLQLPVHGLFLAALVRLGGRIRDLCHQAFPPAPRVHRRGARYPLQRAFAFSASLNRSFRKHPFGASFIDYWLGGHRIASAAQAPLGRAGHHMPATVRSFEPTDACLWQTSPRVHLTAALAGRETTAICRCALRSLFGELSARAPDALCLSAPYRPFVLAAQPHAVSGRGMESLL